MGARREVRAAALTALDKFALDEIAALAGGLVLIPENLNHLARLESLAMCAVARASSGRRSITRTSARKLLNHAFAAWVGNGDDPCDTLATQAFTYHGGTHVFIAPDPYRLYALKILSEIIVQSGRLPDNFVHAATGLIQGVCELSDLIAARAQLVRNTTVPQFVQDISVPPEPSLKAILSAVRFSNTEIDALSQRTMLRRIDLESLSASPGDCLLSDPPYATKHLETKPLLRLGDDIVVIAPHRLAEALVYRIVQISAEMEVHALLVDGFHSRMCFMVDRNLKELGLRLTSDGLLAAFTNFEDANVAHAIYQCDRDKVLHVAIVSDCWRCNEGGSVPTPPKITIEEEVKIARESIAGLLASAVPQIATWSSLVVLGCMKDCAISLPGPKKGEPDLLLFLGADLETINLAEGAERSALLLWKYAQALRDMQLRGTIFAWSPLDQYALWRKHERAFPVNFDVVYVDSTLGRELREHAVARYDWHAIPARTPGKTIEVGFAYGPEQPIYIPRGARTTRVEIAVERPGIVIWIASSRDLDEAVDERTHWFEIGRMMAHWLAEFSCQLVAEFANLGAVSDVIVVEFELLAREQPVPAVVGYQITKVSKWVVYAAIHPSFLENYDDTNALERQFVADLVKAVLSLAAISNDMVTDSLARALESVAPPGVKRMLHRIDTSRSPEFIGAASLPRPRYPHSAELNGLRRKVLSALPLPEAEMDNLVAVKWLNSAVGNIYKELRGLLVELDARDILGRLLVNNEALVYEDALSEKTLASQLACYHSAETMRERLLEEGPRRSAASTVTRFLIEHVAAEPPTGTRLVSDLELDTLLAMGFEIIMLGMASDIAQLELADIRIRTEDGNLIVDRGTYQNAAQDTFFAITQEQWTREQSRERIPGFGRDNETAEPSALIGRLEAASRDEFGVELSAIGKVLGEAIALAQERSVSLVAVSRALFAKRVGERLSLSGKIIDVALRSLTLSPRGEFTKPPAGFKTNDIWPWCFNRGLSYIRRPFVVIDNTAGDAELHFTPGHVYRASRNLIALITTGRFKAQSKSLRQVMGEFTKEASNAFNKEVAQVLRERGMVVGTQVSKFGKERIADSNGKALGDIDVLCLDVSTRRIFAIECKDFQMARVPHEVRTDLEALFISSDRKRCAQEKHLRRVAWLQHHADLVVSSMGVDPTGGRWRVEGAFAFSVPLISPLLGHARLPIWTLQDLRDGRPL